MDVDIWRECIGWEVTHRELGPGRVADVYQNGRDLYVKVRFSNPSDGKAERRFLGAAFSEGFFTGMVLPRELWEEVERWSILRTDIARTWRKISNDELGAREAKARPRVEEARRRVEEAQQRLRMTELAVQREREQHELELRQREAQAYLEYDEAARARYRQHARVLAEVRR